MVLVTPSAHVIMAKTESHHMYDQLFKGTDTLGPNASVARQFGNTGKLSSNFYSAAELSVGHLAALLKCAV